MSVLLRLSRLPGVKQGLTIPSAKPMICRYMCKVVKKSQDEIEIGENSYVTKKEWVSYGFDPDDEVQDRAILRQTMFAAVTVSLIGTMFYLCYLPDPKNKDWAQREAYIQLRYREENGLPLIDPNVVDPAKLNLPSDEELYNFPITI